MNDCNADLNINNYKTKTKDEFLCFNLINFKEKLITILIPNI